MKLVLEGGGSRAAYGAGFVDAVAQAQLPVRAVLGCSSGSINAAFLASGQTETLCGLWSDYVPGKHFISWRRQFTPGAGPGLAIDDMLDRVIVGQGLLDCLAATAGRPALYVSVTDVATARGQLVKPRAETLVEWLRASLALPVGYNRLVRVEGRDYVDGGVALPVPFDEPLETPDVGPTIVVLTRRMSTEKRGTSWWQKLFMAASVPRAVRLATYAQHELHNAVMLRLRKAAERGEVVVVEPPQGMPLSRLSRDAGALRDGIEIGRETGRRFCESWAANAAAAAPAPEAQRASVDAAQ